MHLEQVESATQTGDSESKRCGGELEEPSAGLASVAGSCPELFHPFLLGSVFIREILVQR